MTTWTRSGMGVHAGSLCWEFMLEVRTRNLCRKFVPGVRAGSLRREFTPGVCTGTGCRNLMPEPDAGTGCQNQMPEPDAGTGFRNWIPEPDRVLTGFAGAKTTDKIHKRPGGVTVGVSFPDRPCWRCHRWCESLADIAWGRHHRCGVPWLMLESSPTVWQPRPTSDCDVAAGVASMEECVYNECVRVPEI